MIVNGQILRAWPNYIIIPVMLALWAIVGALAVRLLAAPSSSSGAAPS